jgi:hypothetical protein
MFTNFFGDRKCNISKLTQLGKHARSVAGTENYKHDNHEIIKIENKLENGEKHRCHEKRNAIHFIAMSRPFKESRT